MLKMLYRLRRKHGAVLFAVISIMALLIAMASAAYYTARGSYNTVVSNYDYSQLYLSAVSAADMVTEAVMNSASTTGAGATYTDKNGNAYDANQFTALQGKIKTMTEGQIITAKSKNITASVSDATANEDILTALASSGESVIDGALDGLTVQITFVQDRPVYAGTTPIYVDPVTGMETYEAEYERTYKVKTTAFYRDNYVEVEDVIRVDYWENYDQMPGTPGTPETIKKVPIHHEAEYEYIKVPKGDSTAFNTFFTATGQKLNPDGSFGNETTRCVKINTHSISDDAYFDCANTYFVDKNASNNFLGGVTSAGNLYLGKFTCDPKMQEPDNDWFVGESLVIMQNNSNNLNMGKQNSLYVGKDLVLNANANITAKDIYIKGDLYLIGQCNLNANVHVDGNIYYNKTAGGTGVFEQAAVDGMSMWENSNTNPSRINGKLDMNGSIVTDGTYNGFAELNVNESSVEIKLTGNQNNDKTIASGDKASKVPGVGTWDPETTTTKYHTTITNKDEDKFERQENESSVQGAMNSVIGSMSQTDYGVVTSKQETYDSVLTLDFSQMNQLLDANNQPNGYEGTFDIINKDGSVVGQATAKIEKGQENSEVVVSLPYIENGYTLDIPADTLYSKWESSGWNGSPIGGNANIRYEIQTGSKAMPIVLAPNTNAPGTASDTENAFNWKGDSYAGNDGSAQVALLPSGGKTGNVVFEMANYKTDADGNKTFMPYDPKDGSLSVTEYIAGRKVTVGTEAQVDKIGKDGVLDDSKVNSMLQSGSSKPLEQFKNCVMLVSNANGKTAIHANTQNNALCGYIYAPNGTLEADSGDGGHPVFGGMIVSTYNAGLNKFTYAEPNPSDISDMTSAMNGSIGGGGDYEEIKNLVHEAWTEYKEEIVPATPATSPIDPHNHRQSDTRPYTWQDIGSNYIG